MTVLVDSNRVIDYLKGWQEAIELLDRLFASSLAISVITYAEVYEGIYYGRDPRGNELAFRRFLEGVPVLGISRAVARRFASIRGDLRAAGLLIPQPDLLIAATAIEHRMALLTRNQQHFQRIPGLQIY